MRKPLRGSRSTPACSTAVRALPRVSDAAYTSFLPMTLTGGIWPVSVDGRPQEIRSAGDVASLRFVTPGFFAALRIPLRAGRDVRESDTLDRPAVSVVSESFARHYWPGQDPLGRRFRFGLQERTIVGVVGDVRVRGIERSSEPQVYLPYRQVPDDSLVWYAPKDLALRSTADAAALLPAIRRIIAAADPQQPVSNVQTLQDIVDQQTAPRAVELRVLGAFAALALLLAAIGIHGVLSFAFSQRAREIGVRIALGARPGDILALVLGRGALLAAAGVLPGLALAYAAGRSLQALLAGVQPSDAGAFLSAAALAFAMTLAGSFLPALRAIRVDPISAIRSE